jgi:hypothetical protein
LGCCNSLTEPNQFKLQLTMLESSCSSTTLIITVCTRSAWIGSSRASNFLYQLVSLTKLASIVQSFELGHGRSMTGAGRRMARPRTHGAPRRRSRLLEEGKPCHATLHLPHFTLPLFCSLRAKNRATIVATSSNELMHARHRTIACQTMSLALP